MSGEAPSGEPSLAFDPAHADPDPLIRFERWWRRAREASEFADAMTLATVGPDGLPSARMVLLRGFEPGGFVFFTNYESDKARELEANPRAAVVFHWPRLHRQVRASGTVERLSVEASERYWAGRPAGHRIAAWASPQSRVIEDREGLDRRVEDVARRFADRDVPLPPFWGGYRLQPLMFEFWQGRENRLHDRVRYSRARAEDDWRIERLAP